MNKKEKVINYFKKRIKSIEKLKDNSISNNEPRQEVNRHYKKINYYEDKIKFIEKLKINTTFTNVMLQY